MSDETEFGGACAFAVSAGPADKAPKGKAKYTLTIDGRTYVFAGAVPRFLFRIIPGSEARARRRWDASHPA